MLPETISEEWLEKLNQQLSAKQVPHSKRPFEAIREMSSVWNCSVDFNSAQVKSVFRWFEGHSPDGSHATGSLFTAAYYFDVYFWKVSIPLAYGNVELNALDSIEGASQSVRAQLETDKLIFCNYLALWVDAMDYGFGIGDVPHMSKLSSFATELMVSADRKLRATVRLLTEGRQPNLDAMETARMATEIFLKAYLAAHNGLTETVAKRRFYHDLNKLAEECESVSGKVEFGHVKELAEVFQKIDSRYRGSGYNNVTLWNAYCIAQLSATTYVRSLTDRDSRGQMFCSASIRSSERA